MIRTILKNLCQNKTTQITSTYLFRPIAQFSNKKHQGYSFNSHDIPQDQHLNSQPKILQKYNHLNYQIDLMKTQIKKSHDQNKSRDLNKELLEERQKITNLIESGKNMWETTKETVITIEDKQILQFGKQLTEFSKVLKSLNDIPLSGEQQGLVSGLQMTQRILINTLKKFQFEPYEPLKQKFDPNYQIKIKQEKSAQNNKSEIVQRIIEPGWMYKKKLVRPAKVSLNK